MEFPKYYKHDAADREPVDAFIEEVYKDTADSPLETSYNPLQRLHPLQVASRAVAQVCLQAIEGHSLAHGLKPDLAPTFSRLQKLSKGHPWESDVIDGRLLRTTLAMVEARDDPSRIQEQRTIQHQILTDSLQSLIPMYEGAATNLPDGVDRRDISGNIAQYTMLGLLTRLRHPRLLALPSLPHHDRRYSGSPSSNYDITVVESRLAPQNPSELNGSGTSAEIPESQAHKIQVKAPCMGSCEDPRPRKSITRLQERTARGDGMRARYDEDIALVSGCCDLGMRYYKGKRRAPLARLMVKEAAGKASEEEIDILNRTTNQLLLAVTGDPSRRGTVQEPVEYNQEMHEDNDLAPLTQRLSFDVNIIAKLQFDTKEG